MTRTRVDAVLAWRPTLSRRALVPVILLGGALYVILLITSINRYRELDLSPQWGFLAVAALPGTLGLVLLASVELRLIAHGRGAPMDASSSFRTTLLASSANALPLPGAVIVRVNALARRGVSGAGALSGSAAAGVSWMATSATILGLAIGWRGVPVLAVAAVGYTAGFRLHRRHLGSGISPWGSYGRLVLVEAVIVSAELVRFAFVLRALGNDPDLVTAASLSLANVVSAAIGIVPSGIGLREGLAGIFAIPLAIDPSISIAASAIDRILTVAVLLTTAILVLGPAALRSTLRTATR